MKNNSIKKTLPRMIMLMASILLLLILPVNIWLQLKLQHKSQLESSQEVFGQLEQLLEMNEKDLEKEKKKFSEKCIQSAEMVAYFIDHNPSVITNLEQSRELAEKLGVDEIHYFTKEGEIYSGTHPEYYGYTFRSGEQMMFFLPMLEDVSLKMCQEITVNTSEGKKMQYAAVWMKDESGIVQVGMKPNELLKEIDEKSLEKMVSALPIDLRGHLHIVDKRTDKIIASTSENMVGEDMRGKFEKGKQKESLVDLHYQFNGQKYCVYTHDYGDYKLVRTYLSYYPVQEVVISTVLVLLYIGFVSLAVMGIIMWYVKNKLSDNLMLIINNLKKVEDGNLENIMLETGIKEFDELIFYINHLLKSIRLSWNKLSDVIDKGQLPVGIFEYNTFYKKTFINERLLEILGIEDYKNIALPQLTKLVQDRLAQAEEGIVNGEEQVYEYDKNGSMIYMHIEKVIDEQCTTYYVTDISLWCEEIHQLKEQSNRDVLTDFYNRRGFCEQLDVLFSKLENIGYAAMLILDADGLKKINDIYGHHIGDEYLRAIEKVIRDSIGENSVCARLGGDEFAVFLYGYSSYQQVDQVVNILKSKRGEAFLRDTLTQNETVEFSVGCAFYPMDGIDYQLLMHVADERMYQEKRKRKKLRGEYKINRRF